MNAVRMAWTVKLAEVRRVRSNGPSRVGRGRRVLVSR